MFDKDYRKYLPLIYDDSGNVVKLEEWKLSMDHLAIKQDAFLKDDNALDLDRCNNIIDSPFKIENDCIRFVVEAKNITDSTWE